VITKCDKVSKNEKARQSALIARTMGVPKDDLSFFSALSREGTEGIWSRIEILLTDTHEEETGHHQSD